MLSIRFSNRFEELLEALLGAIAEPPASVFESQEIIVPSAAVRRAVELGAADRFGISSNIRFAFLAQWLWRQIGHVVDVAETSPFTTPVLTWRVLAILSERDFVAAHPPLSRYLDNADDVMRYELANRTAALLEQYLTYRPDWLAAWLAGEPAAIGDQGTARAEDERWQRALWTRIARDMDTGARHPSIAYFDAIRHMGAEAPARAGLPAAAHVFCVPAMPPLYLEMLRGLAQWIDVSLHVINPCREYWLDVVPPRRLSWLVAHERADHHEVGNRLLAGWGRQAQSHIGLLLDTDATAVIDDACFVATDATTLLGRLQNAVLDLVDLPRGSIVPEPIDRSIEVHVCHSMTRQLEVLHDQLLALFAAPNPPRPCDVLVVVPDLVAAAPLIDTVFGNAPKTRTIPYAISGLPASRRNVCAHALLSLLEVAASRFPASAVFELLQQPIIGRRFGVGDTELAAIHGWIRDSGIRWGFDGPHRGALGLPPVAEYSFSDGLDRLFLGYALPASTALAVNGRLAAGDAEGLEALALGSFQAFVSALERLRTRIVQPKTPDGWRSTLSAVIDELMAPERDEIEDARETLLCIDELNANMREGAAAGVLHIDVVRAALEAVLDDPARGGVPTGAVTFAAMSSLRHLPYRIVCMVGLDDGVFPSATRQPEFDLMAQAPRRGDRQRRADERNLFLDLLLAARERVYLSYTGRSVRDNAPLPPSVLVSELVDYCAAAIDSPPFSPETLAAARRRLVVEHPLQPFSPVYFAPDADPRRVSFNDEYCAALSARLAAATRVGIDVDADTPGPAGDPLANAADPDDVDVREPQQAFFRDRLGEAGPEYREVTLAMLSRFFRNPCEFLLAERLEIRLATAGDELDDDEPFTVEWSARDALARRVLPQLIAGATVDALSEYAAAGIDYPPGRLGALERHRELERLDAFARKLAASTSAPAVAPITAALAFAIEGERWTLTGGFSDLTTAGRVRHRYDDVRASDYLSGWIEHLFLCAVCPDGVAARTMWHSRDGVYALRPVRDAYAQLQALLCLYRDGMRAPLHFYPRSAWAYSAAGSNLAKAADAWQSTRFFPHREDRNPAYRLALRGVQNPLDAEFEHCATTVFAPLLEHIEDARLEIPARAAGRKG